MQAARAARARRAVKRRQAASTPRPTPTTAEPADAPVLRDSYAARDRAAARRPRAAWQAAREASPATPPVSACAAQRLVWPAGAVSPTGSAAERPGNRNKKNEGDLVAQIALVKVACRWGPLVWPSMITGLRELRRPTQLRHHRRNVAFPVRAHQFALARRGMDRRGVGSASFGRGFERRARRCRASAARVAAVAFTRPRAVTPRAFTAGGALTVQPRPLTLPVARWAPVTRTSVPRTG